jgi:hypothetical protein
MAAFFSGNKHEAEASHVAVYQQKIQYITLKQKLRIK